MTLAAVLVIVLGVGATLGVRHFLIPEPEERATTDINVVADPAANPDPPRDIELQVIAPNGGPGEPGKVRVSWQIPDTLGEDDFFRVQWAELPSNYQEFAAPKDVYGQYSTVIDIPPQQAKLCVTVQTLNRNGGASQVVEKCLNGG